MNPAINHHLQLVDSEFEQSFADGTMDGSLFNHEAHIRLAWIHITRYGIAKAIDNITRQLKNYTVIQGAADKYNETVTAAAVRTVYHFVLKSGSNNFSDFVAEFPDLTNRFRDLLGSHYSPEILHSFAAKEKYQAPDLLPFD